MSPQYLAQPIPKGSYQQEYWTLVINTPIHGPSPFIAFNKEFITKLSPCCQPFIENSFIYSPSHIPSPIYPVYQSKLFYHIMTSSPKGYAPSPTHLSEPAIPWFQLPLTTPLDLFKLWMLTEGGRNVDDVLNLLENDVLLLQTYYYFNHCMWITFCLKKEAAEQ